jgi:hypothetical protein
MMAIETVIAGIAGNMVGDKDPVAYLIMFDSFPYFNDLS